MGTGRFWCLYCEEERSYERRAWSSTGVVFFWHGAGNPCGTRPEGQHVHPFRIASALMRLTAGQSSAPTLLVTGGAAQPG